MSNFQSQKGQTLIETLAALFILVMGVTSALGLALYAFSSSTSVTKQIIATGLAREGVEAVKNMRDDNWLNSSLSVNGCYDYYTGQSSKANCYTQWLGTGGPPPPFCLNPTTTVGVCDGGATTMNYVLSINNSLGAPGSLWNLIRQVGVTHYGMSFDPSNSGRKGFYNQDGTTDCSGAGIADYCRKIIITKVTTGGSVYDPSTYGGAQNPGPLLQVQSQVWWIDKKCPRVLDFTSAPAGCRVELDTYLTNWKNYQIP